MWLSIVLMIELLQENMNLCDIMFIGCDNVNKIKIDVNDYIDCGLGDIYYGLITFISNYVTTNYNPMEAFETGDSKYAVAVITMKGALKELLDYFKSNDDVYLPSLNRKVKISTLNIEEQLALEERCKDYLIAKLNMVLSNNLENQTPHKSI